MRNVLLVQPPSNMRKLQRIKSKNSEIRAPLPLIYIASYLLKEGFDVEILDLRISSLDTLRDYLKEKKPLLAGISIMPGNILPPAISLGSLVKKHSPQTKIVWGGSFPSLHYELCLNAHDVDFVVCGDGEETLTELATALGSGRGGDDISKIKGLAYKTGTEVKTTSPRQPVDLERNPVGQWQLVDKYMNHYLGARGCININTARGCPHKCSFCYNNILYKGFKRYRTKGVDHVMEEIDYLAGRYQIRKILFQDDDFLGNKKRAADLVSRLHGKYPHVKFHIDARAESMSNTEIVGHLAENGLESVFIGAETGSEEQIVNIQKGNTTTDVVEAARVCSRNNVQGEFSFTCGYPGESYKDLYATIKMAEVIKNIDRNNLCFLEIISPIRGTPLFGDLEKQKLLPETSELAKWCYLTDWKSAKEKNWIANKGFYEAFQLCFFLAFTHGSSGGSSLRLHTRIMSKWSRLRIVNRKPRLLPEYRLANYILKKMLWQ